MNNPTDTSNDAWADCSPGELQRLLRSTEIHSRARTIRRTILSGGAATIVVLLAGITASHLWLTRHCIAGLYCEDVRRELPDLVAMRVEPKRAAQLHQHVALCPNCRQLMQQMEDNSPMSLNHHQHDGNRPHSNGADQLALADTPPNHLFTSMFP